MLKLFSVYLGGRTTGCNIELHDVVFVIGESLKHAYPALTNKWFGIKKSLHIDAYIELAHVDGHDIFIRKEKPGNIKKLFFVNFGAYKNGFFGEMHESKFYVGTNKPDILMRAKQELCLNKIYPHCDDNIIIDDIIEIDHLDQYYLHFIPAAAREITVITTYQRLDLPDIHHNI
jgi:hypothetical protein